MVTEAKKNIQLGRLGHRTPNYIDITPSAVSEALPSVTSEKCNKTHKDSIRLQEV